MKLTTNFSLAELTASQVAARQGINNNPTAGQIENLKRLCESILQPIRNHYDSPVIISSGFRTPELCVLIGSSIDSQHAKGEAADLQVSGVDNKKLAEYIKNNLDFDQLILEFYRESEGPQSGWVHVSYVGKGNRKQSLQATRSEKTGKTIYSPW
jgi:zinc D-Ala-D-Ala carboxypeptidase|tara:strand:- start:626 stop:1090 length:465 start_codon:yes stop_codon:yes gene_type:complete